MVKKWLVLLVFVIMIPTLVIAVEADTTKEKKTMNQKVNTSDKPKFTDVSVHDPSIIKVQNEYYVFGSHLAAAKSKDLMNWKLVASGANVTNPLFDNVVEELKETFDWAQTDTLWAADVIQLEDGKFYMYYNACKGDSPRSALGIAVADNIEGPYKDKGIFLKSGMWGERGEDGTIYDATKHPNVVDPDTFFDEKGKLWMLYGSYSGGIFILEMDPKTGFPLPDQGYGKKLLGGNHSRIEGAYIQYHPDTNYYYMYLSFGGLDATGGYNVRVIRSKKPDGPYYDAEGNEMINVKADPTVPLFDDKSIEPYAVKLMGNHLFERKIGDPGEGIGAGYVSPGHNSTYYDSKTGKQFIIFHTRFPERGEHHEIRVHQMFMNQNGWPVIAPYRFAGETIEKIKRDHVIGTYQMINHEKDISAEVKKPVSITLEKNNKISGSLNGTWKKTGHYNAELKIGGKVYSGVFLRQWDEVSQNYVMTFSVLSKEGIALWGSKVKDRTDQEIIEDVKADLDLGDTSNIISNVILPIEGTRGTTVSWVSSNQDVMTDKGVITRPEAGKDPVTLTLTATITKGVVSTQKQFTITVVPKKPDGIVAHYKFEGNLSDSKQPGKEGIVTGDRVDNRGGNIEYIETEFGKSAEFNGQSGIRLPDGLIDSDSYSVALWLNPDELTEYSTAFFGARDSNHWISLVPKGHSGVSHHTMVWAGTDWYDANTGQSIQPNKWTHLAFTVNQGTITIYVNGKETFKGTDFPHVFTTTNGVFSLGVNWWDKPYKGLMDELRIYRGSISAEEIVALAKTK